MTLPANFQFSQNSLQDYVDCPRLFELRYLLRCRWPAIQSEPVLEMEHHLEQGSRFHQLAHQHTLGIPIDQLSRLAQDEELQRWWNNYLHNEPFGTLPNRRLPEYTLATPFEKYRLIAKFDLVAIEPGQRAVIVDWKTASRKPVRLHLKARLQTRLYRFLLVEAGAYLNGGQPIQPDQVEMIYWFTDFPDEPEHFIYSQSEYESDRAYLSQLIQEIQNQKEGQFLNSSSEKRCLFCNYRSLCNRGTQAGDWQLQVEEIEPNAENPLEIDFYQIGEIEL
jgi:CRISPR/Cas system-associated exonuclease Cas4 (RecB family)